MMHFKEKDRYPDLLTCGKFSVGDVVHALCGVTLGDIVRIYQSPFDTTPTIVVDWRSNGRIGRHDECSLVLYMTKTEWDEEFKRRKLEEERDKEQRRIFKEQMGSGRKRKSVSK